MKKFLSIILAVAMILSCTIAFAEETVIEEVTEEVVVEKTVIEEVTEEVVVEETVIEEVTEEVVVEETVIEEVIEEVIVEETVIEEVIEEVVVEETTEEVVEETTEKAISVELDGVALVFDVDPVIINDRTMVPLRVIFEALGAVVNWDDETKTVSAFKEETSVVLQIGTPTLFVGNEAVELDVAAQIVNDRTLIPLRAVSEAFGCKVDWNGDEKKVIIATVVEEGEVVEEVVVEETVIEEVTEEVVVEEVVIEEITEEVIVEETTEEVTEEVIVEETTEEVVEEVTEE